MASVVTPGQEVTAWVLSKEDADGKRLALTLKEPRSGGADGADGGDAKPAGGRGGAAAAKVARSARASSGDAKPAAKQLTVAKKGDWVEGTVKTVLAFGALVEVEEGVDGLLHVSEMSDNPDAKPEAIVKEGDKVRVRIDKIEKDAKTGGEKIRLSMMEKFDVRCRSSVWPCVPSCMHGRSIPPRSLD